MRIAQLVSNLYSIPPKSSKAIYSLAGLLTDELVKRGHNVSLFTTKDSQTLANLEYVTEKAVFEIPGLGEIAKQRYMHLLASRCYQKSEEFDIIHSHFNLLGCYYSPLVKTHTVHTIHSPITSDMVSVLEKVKNQNFISISWAQRKQLPALNWVANIYHGVDTEKYVYNPEPKDYFLFLGRITEQKGVHLAIEAARAAKVKLIIAGKSYSNEDYWHKQIEPFIDGVNIRYIGEADNNAKIEYLKNAKALIFPTHANEPFGMVMIEAMSCGTPVIGYKTAAVPEVVKDGKTGYLVKDAKGIFKAMEKIEKINRLDCRQRAENFFSVRKMVEGYEKVYQRVIEEEIRREFFKK